MTSIWSGQEGNRGSISNYSKKLFSSLYHLDKLWGHPILFLSEGWEYFFFWLKRPGRETDCWVRGVYLHFPYALMACYLLVVTLMDSFTVSLACALFHVHRNTEVEFLTLMFRLEKVMISKRSPQIGHSDWGFSFLFSLLRSWDSTFRNETWLFPCLSSDIHYIIFDNT